MTDTSSHRFVLPAEDRATRLLDAAGAGICEVDAAGTTVYANPRLHAMLGYPPETMIGRKPQDFVDPEDLGRFAERHQAVEAGAYLAEWRLRRADGTCVWVDECSAPIRDADGKPVGRCLVLIDTSSRKRAESVVLDAGRHKDEFLATLAHELRNPLAPIASGLQILHTAPLAGDESGVVSMLQRQVDTLVRLVDDLLEVSRLNEGDITLRKEQIELSTVLTAAVETSQPRIDSRGHHLVISQPPHIMLYADPVRLCQIFANLLNNAAGQMRVDGTIWLTATIQQGDSPALHVTIRDNGPALPDDQIADLMKVFNEPDEAWAHANDIGVGLALVHQLVRLHGGEISVAAGPSGVGTEFRVQLPLSALTAETASDRIAPATGTTTLAGCRVLVVDDNRDAADSVAMLLRYAGATTVVVYNGFAALDALVDFQPHIVLLDIGMPGLNGYELARRIRERHPAEEVLLVAQSGWGQHQDRALSKDAGIDYHMVKPVDFEELQRVIRSYILGRTPSVG